MLLLFTMLSLKLEYCRTFITIISALSIAEILSLSVQPYSYFYSQCQCCTEMGVDVQFDNFFFWHAKTQVLLGVLNFYGVPDSAKKKDMCVSNTGLCIIAVSQFHNNILTCTMNCCHNLLY